jgi:hypothetical protein
MACYPSFEHAAIVLVIDVKVVIQKLISKYLYKNFHMKPNFTESEYQNAKSEEFLETP